jgi:hypothetical protein
MFPFLILVVEARNKLSYQPGLSLVFRLMAASTDVSAGAAGVSCSLRTTFAAAAALALAGFFHAG